MFILGKNWLKYRKKKYYFHNYIFRKFEIVVCFATLLHGVERNPFLNFVRLKSKTCNSWKRMQCNEEARRIRAIRGNGTSRSRMQDRRGRKNDNVPRLLTPLATHRQADWECEALRRFHIWDHWVNSHETFQVWCYTGKKTMVKSVKSTGRNPVANFTLA